MRSAAARIALVTVLAAAVSAGTASPRSAPGRSCTRAPSTEHTRSVLRVLAAGRDVWGDELLATRRGPTYATASRYLPPLFYAVGARGRRVTLSGAYYLALAMPFSPYGSRGFNLHVADGSEIVGRRIGGPHLTIFVGRGGRERFGSCLARLGPARLADGYLPMLETSYVDADGVRYRQESFAARVAGTTSLVSFLHLAIDARGSSVGAVARLTSTSGGARVERVEPGGQLDVYAAWTERRGLERISGPAYARARSKTAAFWRAQLDRAAVVDVPEPRVLDAERALLVQELSMTWRYSVGNPYEELSFAEALSTAEVMAEYGYGDVARAILRFTLRRLSTRFSNFRAGERLVAGALYYRLSRDRAYADEETPGLLAALTKLGRRIERPSGLLAREPVSTDVGTKIYGLHSETAVWEGLEAMGRAWAETGHPGPAARAEALGRRLGDALRRAVGRSQRRLADGSLFVPLALLDHSRPLRLVTESQDGTYWNLLAPYGLASSLFRPHGPQARGVLRFLLEHGGRLLGLVRSADAKLYRQAAPPVSGTDEVYGLAVSRFLADNDEPDQLVLSLYGMLAASMTPDTFVAGEGATVAPLHDQYLRTMLLPPNSGANAAFLETLRLLLVHETRTADGSPAGLELAFATPRAWLEDGKTIRVRRVPTSFGPVSYALARRGRMVEADLDVPTVPSLRLRLRLPSGTRLKAVLLGGRPVRFDARSATIDLSGRHGRIRLEAVTSAAGP